MSEQQKERTPARMKKRCSECGLELTPAPARFDGEPTFVGYYPCQCDEARAEDAERLELERWPYTGAIQ